ncbi:MAG: molybdopterin-dependent oxidoreductase, partial [Anaerolineales bacterium]|nr:molybdopterin-dependent oxidoreductase [Anaerolineales bacterium]
SQHGKDAVGIYLGNPNVHNLGSMLYGTGFIRALRTRNRFSATSVDQLPHHAAALAMFGHQLLLPIPDIDHTDFMLILGANPVVSNGSIMTAGGAERRLKAIQARGGQVVVVDPRRTATAALADHHLFIRPGSDALLLLALNQVLLAEGLANPGHLAGQVAGWDEFARAVASFTPERVSPACGIPASEIRALARAFAGANAAVCYGRMGVSTQQFGGLCQWLINALNIVNGNCDRPGGAMFTLPAFDVVGITAATGSNGRQGRWHSRVRNLPEFNGELPAAALAEEMLTPGEGQIRGLVTVARNPVLSTPNGGQLDEALDGLEFMVAIDIYINETTRHANIILPPTTGLETAQYDLVFHLFAVQNSAKYSPALFEPADDTRHDWQILHELRARLEGWHGQPSGRTGRDKFDFMKRLRPEQVLDLGFRFGPYGSRGPLRQGAGLTLRRLAAAPHGIDLGPLRPCLRSRLNGRQIQLAPDPFLADLTRLEGTLVDSAAASYPLRLIGRRHLRSNNSWMHNSERLVRGKPRCTLLLHPDDADQYDISDGQAVEVSSRAGAVTLPAELTAEIMPGVVS